MISPKTMIKVVKIGTTVVGGIINVVDAIADDRMQTMKINEGIKESLAKLAEAAKAAKK